MSNHHEDDTQETVSRILTVVSTEDKQDDIINLLTEIRDLLRESKQ